MSVTPPDGGQGEQASLSVARLAELLAERLKLVDGELRIAFKDGRYQRAHALLPVSGLPR